MIGEIDFVILWVDGHDPHWQEAFLQARQRAGRDSDASVIRYRDWELLHYWFRGVERFAPWVRRIHLITWGHLPKWLNREHPKLHIVRHEEFIPSCYLPTFNSNTIELNLHRIEGLAERFVLFNDDTFLTAPCPAREFFSKEGLPRDMARLSLVQASSVGHTIYNNLALINAQHPRSQLTRHLGKWLHPTYGVGNLLKSLSLLPWSFFPGFLDHHLPQPYLKGHFSRAWEVWGEALDRACHNSLRELSDLSHWLIRYDVLCRGEFSPRNFRDSRLMNITEEQLCTICHAVESGRYRLLCLNDSDLAGDFSAAKERLKAAFQTLLPHPCTYES